MFNKYSSSCFNTIVLYNFMMPRQKLTVYIDQKKHKNKWQLLHKGIIKCFNHVDPCNKLLVITPSTNT